MFFWYWLTPVIEDKEPLNRLLLLLLFRDVTVAEFEFNCCRIPTAFCKSQILRIFRFIYVKLAISFRFGKPSFIICQSAIRHTKI